MKQRGTGNVPIDEKKWNTTQCAINRKIEKKIGKTTKKMQKTAKWKS